MAIMYIYKLYNHNGYYYYGSSENVNRRFKQHIYAATNGKNTKLYNKMREEGISTFKIEIIDKAIGVTYNDKLKCETEYIKPALNDIMNLNSKCPCLTDDEIKQRTVVCGEYSYLMTKASVNKLHS